MSRIIQIINDSSVSDYQWGDVIYDNTGTSASITGGNTYRISATTPAGTATTVEKPLASKPTEKRVSPRLYFSYVKSKLHKNELKKLKIRLAKLQVLTKDAFDVKQQALYETYAKMMAITVRESEAYAIGFDSWVTKKDIEKFKSIAKAADEKVSAVKFDKLEDYSRTVPNDVKSAIEDASRVFDLFWVLYLDYSGEVLKTNKEKIREKDPILFGQFAYDKERFYYITDWTDQFCDLTLDKFVDTVSTEDEKYSLGKIEELDEEWIEQIKREVAEREERLSKTNSHNYRRHMAEEDKLPATIVVLPWYKRLWSWLFKKS